MPLIGLDVPMSVYEAQLILDVYFVKILFMLRRLSSSMCFSQNLVCDNIQIGWIDD